MCRYFVDKIAHYCKYVVLIVAIRHKKQITKQIVLNSALVNEIKILLANILNGSLFLHANSGKNDLSRILIFATHQNIEIFSNAKIWAANGIFKGAIEQYVYKK